MLSKNEPFVFVENPRDVEKLRNGTLSSSRVSEKVDESGSLFGNPVH